MSGIFCSQCGSQNEEAAVLCANCGVGLPGREASRSRVDRIINPSTPPQDVFTKPLKQRSAPAQEPQPQWANPPAQPHWPGAAPPMPARPVYAAPVIMGCPYCHAAYPPLLMQKISAAGWIVFVILLLTCLPLCWIGLLIKEDYRVCANCGLYLG